MKIIWDSMAKKVLDKEQITCVSLLEEFSKTHILVGGTAIALQIGHRKSIDFDFFSFGKQGTGKQFLERINKTGLSWDPKLSNFKWLSDEEQSDVLLYTKSGVKIQFIDFSINPFDVKLDIKSNKTLCHGIKSLDLLTLGAFKAYAMMYRTKWKDAVDLYYIINKGYNLSDIIKKAKSIFKDLYKPIATYENIVDDSWDMSEQVDYMDSKHPSDSQIRKFLIDEVKNKLNSL